MLGGKFGFVMKFLGSSLFMNGIVIDIKMFCSCFLFFYVGKIVLYNFKFKVERIFIYKKLYFILLSV